MSMRRFRPWAAVSVLLLLASCAPRPAPPPAPPPVPPPSMPAPPPPPPPPPHWQDAPLADGDWHYRQEAGRSLAAFGNLFAIRCEPGRRISLIGAGAAGPSTTVVASGGQPDRRMSLIGGDAIPALTIVTSGGHRSLTAWAGPEGLTAQLAADDPLLDAIAFSRGRFAVQASGAAMFVLPAWPEPARVIEDCRG